MIFTFPCISAKIEKKTLCTSLELKQMSGLQPLCHIIIMARTLDGMVTDYPVFKDGTNLEKCL